LSPTDIIEYTPTNYKIDLEYESFRLERFESEYEFDKNWKYYKSKKPLDVG